MIHRDKGVEQEKHNKSTYRRHDNIERWFVNVEMQNLIFQDVENISTCNLWSNLCMSLEIVTLIRRRHLLVHK